MNNLSFYKWFDLREADEYSPDIKNGLEIFMKPDDNVMISAASIIDGNLTDTHVPFIYLESTDTIYSGITEGYHDNLIYAKIREDANIGLQLRKAYDGIYQTRPDVVAAVGRIGYRINFDKLKRRLPNDNIKRFLYGEDQTNWPERVNLDAIGDSFKRIFNQIDLIAIYATSRHPTISVGAAACKKLEQDGKIIDPLKTIVVFGNKAYIFSEFISYYVPPYKPEPVINVEPPKDIKKPMSLYPKDFKPETWPQAKKWVGLPPTIGDWNTNHQKWFNLREADEYFPTIENGLEIFKKPDEIIDISAAEIIDGELTAAHKPFIYLESTDTNYLGENKTYHRQLIDNETRKDENIGRKLIKAYNGIYSRFGDVVSAVGRIGYRTDFDQLKFTVTENNLKKFLYGDDQTNWPETINFHAISNKGKRIFDQIDLISIYQGPQTPISVAAAACKKLKEDGELRDPLKTVVFFNNKVYMFDEFIPHAEYFQSIVEPVIQREPSKDTKKEPASFFPKDFKPKTWKDARKWAGLPPTIGDWTNNG
jgi:uncharacterized protein YkuJ